MSDTSTGRPCDRLPSLSAHSLKCDVAYSYAEADKGPVAIVKGRGKGRWGNSEGRITHVLMSADYYDRLSRALPQEEEA